jgi:hypothetical protein
MAYNFTTDLFNETTLEVTSPQNSFSETTVKIVANQKLCWNSTELWTLIGFFLIWFLIIFCRFLISELFGTQKSAKTEKSDKDEKQN